MYDYKQYMNDLQTAHRQLCEKMKKDDKKYNPRRKPKLDKDVMANHKCRLQMKMYSSINSILHWCTYSPVSLLMVEFVDFAFNHKLNERFNFIDESDFESPILKRGVQWNATKGEFDGEGAELFRDAFGFVVGCRVGNLAFEWFQFQSFLTHLSIVLFDGKATLRYAGPKHIEYFQKWLQFWQDLKMKICDVYGSIGAWQATYQK